ncbi:hypothetical protein FRACYDRAFT_233845 [Fragilariopsis cylindrus CCMP1102]|uniref:Uncharacterized protein n=1 Tax=Fragilariopsis cylindrus CCMP1102 TaxID=635003 RepID=A0A1E7G0D5_9STRA|nr:hypothetical protein FRACYDRAFT_233845 [Fragilariopsis cylindrus CCMP1102]|eukprot:OEU23673.1 hypothetical protein FRACYDRAFT_233845 [Fragilariopsis cylindrus CCMP1102]
MTIQRPRRKYYYELAENGIIVLNDSGDDNDDHNDNGVNDADQNKKQRELQEEKQRIDILKERLYRLKKSTLDSSFCIHKIEEYDTTSSIIELLQKHLVTSENNYMKAIATATTTTTTGGGGPNYGYVCNINVEIVVNSSQIKKIDDTIMIIKKERRRRSLSSASSSTLLSSSLSSECYQNL